MDLAKLTLKSAHQGLKDREFSSEELTCGFLNNIEKSDKEIHAFINVNQESAINKAKEVDKKIKNGGKIDILSGLPCAIKDNILMEGLKTTAGSKILENFLAPYDASVIKKLKEKDAVFLGKTNLDEFAMGSSGENSAFFPTKNPRDLTRVPGGSSAGSAAAVAGGMCLYALGSDTGGSVRQPAAFCGLVGLKPTYGRVSRYGLIALTSSTDVIGTLTRTVEDAAYVLEAMAGVDKRDATTKNIKVDDYPADLIKTEKKLKIGLPKEYFSAGLADNIKQAIEKVVKKIASQGFEIVEISLPHTEYAVAAYYIITPSEASSNLARYDGIKFGLAENKSYDLLETYLNSREEGLGAEPKRRIMLGTFSLSSGYYDDYYLIAMKARRLIAQDFKNAFEKVDLILTPTTPTLPFKIGEKQSPLEMYLSDIFLTAPSLAGLPAIALPFYNGGKLPYSLQLIGDHFSESRLLSVSNFIEKGILAPSL
ncbi:MAG: Asp-tRNA(Asn)/Glu-tRNA(Gln) amidotransferase subunit GatA [Patescibacteria group bacterium]